MGKRFDPVALDAAILDALRTHGQACTYVIRNRLAMFKGDLYADTGLETRHVLTGCKRLLKRGQIVQATTNHLVMMCWQIAP